MHTYIGTKTVLATAMLLGAYNALRGWEPPEGEDQTAEGYLVEYTDGGKPNHPDYAGYISWSPKAVFDASYRLADTAKQRVGLEFLELSDRLARLRSFMASPAFERLDAKQRGLLADQNMYMASYAKTLNDRLNNWVEV